MLICFLYIAVAIAVATVLAYEARLRYVQLDRPRSQFLFIWHCPGGLAAPIQLKRSEEKRLPPSLSSTGCLGSWVSSSRIFCLFLIIQ